MHTMQPSPSYQLESKSLYIPSKMPVLTVRRFYWMFIFESIKRVDIFKNWKKIVLFNIELIE